MKTKTIIIVFVLVAIVQLVIPAKMVVDHHKVLTHGKVFKLKIAPVDPIDHFRGKYMTLRVEENHWVDKINDWKYGDDVFVIMLLNTTTGFAKITDLTRKQPPHSVDFIKAKVGNVDGDTVEIDYPFEKYYVDEFKASKAEQLYREASRNENSYVIVSVLDGRAVLKDLVLNNKSVKEIK